VFLLNFCNIFSQTYFSTLNMQHVQTNMRFQKVWGKY